MALDFLWWRDGIIYQIYPRSFQDTTGNGIGDLNGILERLDYLRDLGVDAIWLSPIYPSPDVDFGYDVSDYCAIDPKFGSMRDFERLVLAARKNGIRVMMDLVLNHTSDQHNWFKQSRSYHKNPYRDWYIWSDPCNRGKPPNNWQSVFGGRAWHWDELTQQYYYHMFYRQQPDLNWRNPKVRQAMLDVFRFWSDKGVQGFRLDVFNVYFKDALLRSNPTKLIGRRPFDRQLHLFDFDQPELMSALYDIRKVLDNYPETYAVGETFYSSPRKASSYCSNDGLHAAFNFEFAQCGWNAWQFAKRIDEWETALGEEKWPNYVLNNHDTVRSATRYANGKEDQRLKIAAAMLLTLRGTPFLYYGEEIGMRDIRLKRSQILDPIGRHYWPFFKGRDGCRAPMQWEGNLPFAGFSQCKPWLPFHPDFQERNVADQSRDSFSLLNFYKQVIALRRTHSELTSGSYQQIQDTAHGVLRYERKYERERTQVLLNFTKSTKQIILEDKNEKWIVGLSSQSRSIGNALNDEIDLMPDEALILFHAD